MVPLHIQCSQPDSILLYSKPEQQIDAMGVTLTLELKAFHRLAKYGNNQSCFEEMREKNFEYPLKNSNNSSPDLAICSESSFSHCMSNGTGV